MTAPGGVLGALGFGWLMVSTAAVVIVLAAPVPPLVIAGGRVLVTALLWAGIALYRARRTEMQDVVWPTRRVVLSGVLLGAHFAAWIASFSLTSVAHGAVLVALQPLFAGVFGLLVGDRAPLGRLGLGVLVAGAGTLLMTGSEGASEGVSLAGDLLAIAAGAASALYLTVNRGIGESVPLPSLLARVNFVAAATIALCVPVFGGGWWHPDARFELHGVAILWLGLGPGLVGHGLMNWAARRVPVHLVSMVILLEPVGAAGLAWWLLDQHFSPSDGLGALLLLAGAAIASRPASGAPNPPGRAESRADEGA